MSAAVTSHDGQRGLTVATLSLLRPRLAQPSGLSPDREVPDDQHHNRPLAVQPAFTDARTATAGRVPGRCRGL